MPTNPYWDVPEDADDGETMIKAENIPPEDVYQVARKAIALVVEEGKNPHHAVSNAIRAHYDGLLPPYPASVSRDPQEVTGSGRAV